ncbi:hypothetical protein [Thalassotalea sp. Y01]|uniref:hypothetical protein n=1 Tax=Thalassotalea sp. Y01 TaxID=2729613 RepID=UPI00145E668F|nr:hypothetical protein [Thalassotalea sp. Y01]NMP17606.1 hypothetical protein [Thalassotalea sp. Y01]
MKIKSIITMLAAVAVLMTGAVNAEGKRYDKAVSWKNVVKIDFKPGKRGAALKIIKEYYRPATEKAGTNAPEMILELQTGDYDLLVVWHMKGGINDMTWETNPEQKQWRAALNEIAGSEEKAKEILDEYISYVHHAESQVAITR